MYYIFNKDNNCIGKCSVEPNLEDLQSRKEYAKESDQVFNIFDLSYDEDFVVATEEEIDDSAKIEHLWVKSELDKVDVELMYHWTGDTTRQSYTEQDWKDYAIALRNYTTLIDNTPVINAGSRPISPYNTTLEE